MSTPTAGTVSQHVEFEREANSLHGLTPSQDNVFGGKFPWLLIFGWFFPAFYFNASVSYFGGYLLDAYGIWKQSIPTPIAHSEAEINGDALVTIFVSISTILAFFALWQCNIIRVPLDMVSVFGMIIVYSTSILLSSAIFSRRGDTATPAPFTVLAMYTSGTIALSFTFSVAVTASCAAVFGHASHILHQLNITIEERGITVEKRNRVVHRSMRIFSEGLNRWPAE
ncbi:hypothetical protein DL96DRAFT_1716055 [Flagelloscypha sp. PMI_526]|nr:hypothetical protein DL96DRAFT_1716055 [Flagelloscypha sp. PMI_526]